MDVTGIDGNVSVAHKLKDSRVICKVIYNQLKSKNGIFWYICSESPLNRTTKSKVKEPSDQKYRAKLFTKVLQRYLGDYIAHVTVEFEDMGDIFFFTTKDKRESLLQMVQGLSTDDLVEKMSNQE